MEEVNTCKQKILNLIYRSKAKYPAILKLFIWLVAVNIIIFDFQMSTVINFLNTYDDLSIKQLKISQQKCYQSDLWIQKLCILIFKICLLDL